MDGLFGVGPLELIIVIALALVVLGPERLPETIRQVVRFIKQTRAIGTELTKQFSDELNLLDDFNPKKILQDVVDLDEEFDGKELLGIDKKDLKIDDVDLGDKASKTSKPKKNAATENPLSPPEGPKTPPLQSIKKTKPTKPALGETDPEDTTTSAAVVATKAATETAQESSNADIEAGTDQIGSNKADAGQESSVKEAAQEADASSTSTASPAEGVQPSSESSDGALAEPVTENRIAPPSMSTAQSLVAGKPASATTGATAGATTGATTQSSAQEDPKAADTSNGAKTATTKSNAVDVSSGSVESTPAADLPTDAAKTKAVEAEAAEEIEDTEDTEDA